VTFILGLKMLSHPLSARKGNLIAAAGMAIAIAATIFLYESEGKKLGNYAWIFGGLILGTVIGALAARKVKMTAMPEMVSLFNGMGGACAALISIVEYDHLQHQGFALNGAPVGAGTLMAILLGLVIGTISFAGSVIAWGKLNGSIRDRSFKGQHLVNIGLLMVVIVLAGYMVWQGGRVPSYLFYLVFLLSALYGILFVMPIGGADMPVVVSMLNSYSGWAAAGIGFSLNNSMLIIAGSLVGSSGAILSYIMCKAMNRSFFSVILGGFGGETSTVASGAEQKTVKSGSSDDAAFVMSNADSVIIVPGYGLAVARAQHAVKEMAAKLTEKGVTVRYAIHPVAGRMPGHMNVLLAEAEIPYDQVLEMEDINSDFGTTDVVMVLGANDVVNPLAEVKGSPIYGMPILEAHKARTVIVNKRSMASGYAGLDNPLFYLDKTMMVFGDAKKVVEDIVKALD